MTGTEVDALRLDVVRYAREMLRAGLVTGTSGNLSGREPGGETFLVTPSGVDYESMEPTALVEVGLDGVPLSEDVRPSVDTPIHAAIYLQRPDVGAVIHTHSPYAAALSTLHIDIPPLLSESAGFLGGAVRVIDYVPPARDDTGPSVAGGLGSDRAVLLPNHGVLAVGENLRKAFHAALAVEESARIACIARGLGEPHPVSAAEVSRLNDFIHNRYGRPKRSGVDPATRSIEQDRHRLPPIGRGHRCSHEGETAQIVAPGAFRLAVLAYRAGELGQAAPAIDPPHGFEGHRLRLAPPPPNHHQVGEAVFVAATCPPDLTALEVHPPLAGPGGGPPGADPARPVADNRPALENDRRHRGRRPVEAAPRRIPRLAGDPDRLPAEDHAEQVEVVDRHVDKQRLVVGVVGVGATRPDRRRATEVDQDLVQLAQRRLPHQPGHLADGGKEAVVLADHEDQSTL